MGANYNLPTGDDAVGQYFIRYGFANWMWQNLEADLQQLFMISLDTNSINYSAIAFHTLRNFRYQLQITDELLKHRLKDIELFGKWVAIRKKLRESEKKRNDLVHLPFLGVVTHPDLGLPSFISTKSLNDPRNLEKGYLSKELLESAISESKLEQFAEAFLTVHRETFAFSIELEKYFVSNSEQTQKDA